MRFLYLIGATLVTLVLVFLFDTREFLPAPLGRLLSPQHGIWQNAEPVDQSFNEDINLPSLNGKADVYFDERLVPHIFAEQEDDAYFIQGYIHAKFRLWQMEFQTHAAAGRLSEILGEGPGGRILDYDRNMRRLGMAWSAERSAAEMENSPEMKAQVDAYANGVNAYIDQLTESALPVEYKLLGYYPEKWTTLKTALFLKYMSYSLAGGEDDLELTNARNNFTETDFDQLYYILADSLKPIVPNSVESRYPDSSSISLIPPPMSDSLYYGYKPDSSHLSRDSSMRPNKENGSNNWAVAGSKTKSGRPILCNDPHLGLNLPSLWFEMQIVTPNFNVYGVSFPGSPSIIIGFNQDIAWGVTNAGRDVRDYYAIEFQDGSKTAYKYNGDWMPAGKRVEVIKIKGAADMLDTVTYTTFGPVMYDEKYKASEKETRNLAVRWKAHDPRNDGLVFYLLNHAKNYEDYLAAIKNFTCPGQNFLFASKTGEIAIWQQGEFPAKWFRQGDFIMPGTDSSYNWRGMIPQDENPHLHNPLRGYLSSANQMPVDSSYPYYIGSTFPVYRGLIINRYLDTAQQVDIDFMKRMQTDNYNVKAEFARDILMRVNTSGLDASSIKYLDIFQKWNNRNDPEEAGATVFNLWWSALEKATWQDEFDKAAGPVPWPGEYVLVESLHLDSGYHFIDNINTPQKESLEDLLAASLKSAADSLDKLAANGKLEWAKAKDTHVSHLLKVIDPFSRLHLPVGGGKGIINATTNDHGPSWRMIVQMTDEIEAYGIYPGGQSGNPGSKFYDDGIDEWAAGKYHKLWVMKKTETTDARVKWTMHFRKSG